MRATKNSSQLKSNSLAGVTAEMAAKNPGRTANSVLTETVRSDVPARGANSSCFMKLTANLRPSFKEPPFPYKAPGLVRVTMPRAMEET